MNLFLENNNLSYIVEARNCLKKQLQEDTISKGKNAVKAEQDTPEGINGIKMGSDEMSEDAALAAAAIVPASIIGWQHVRHKIGF